MKTLKTSAFLLSIVMLFSVSAPAFAADTTASGVQVQDGELFFSDVAQTNPYYTAIMSLYNREVLKGYEDGTFKPDNTINRAEVLKIILKGSAVDSPEEFGEVPFPDVPTDAWFTRFVMKAKDLGIVKGNEDGSFAPARNVNKAEFLKMLLEANQIKSEALTAAPNVGAADVPADAWFAKYLNYAASVGITSVDANNNLNPNKDLTRGEVAEMMYLLSLIRGKYDTSFLLESAEMEMSQIDVFIGVGDIELAKNASELAVDLTQQALANMPEDKVVLGDAKLARAYEYLINSFVAGVSGDAQNAIDLANAAIDKASEAWEANNATQTVARHIKDVARNILAQLGGEES